MKKDIAIIGSGAAGLTAALYGARAGLSTVVFDGKGGQILEIDRLENFPGIFPFVSGSDFLSALKNQAESFGAEFVFEKAESIDKKGSFFVIKTASGNIYESKTLIYAAGALHSRLNVPGERELSGKGVSYCAVCDGPFFKNKKVSVVGGGDSACSEALYLSNIASQVDIFHRRGQFRASDYLVKKVLSNEKIKVHFNTEVTEISGRNHVDSLVVKNTESGVIEKFETDAVFVFTGMKPSTALVEILKKDSSGYIITDEKMQTKVPGLYAAGDVRAKPLRQVLTAASDGAIAAMSAAEYVKISCNC